MPHGDHEVPPGEHHQLAGLHHLAGGRELVVLHVADGLEDGEQHVVVALDLGPLVRVHRVLDRERVQAEALGDPLELGLGRLVQPDPAERTGAVRQLLLGLDPAGGLARAAGLAPALAVLVDRAVHDGRAGVVGSDVVHPGRAATAVGADGGAQAVDHRHGGLPEAGAVTRRRGRRNVRPRYDGEEHR